MTEPIATAPETAAEQSITSEQRMAELEARLAAAEAEVARLGEEFLRAKAETENTRRRAAEDVARAHKFGIESFAASMLPVRDSLEAALAVESASVESLREGVQITARQLATAFEKAGLAEVSPMGQKFDPHRHQALSQVASGEEPNTVITVVQKGYVLYDRVIRPALVIVAKEKSAPTPPSA